MTPETKLSPRIRVIRHIASHWEISQGLASGIRAIQHAEAASIAIFLNDMPWLSGKKLHHLQGAIAPERIVVPTFRGMRGASFAFKSQLWQTLNLLIADSDGINVTQAYPNSVDLPELGDTHRAAFISEAFL